MQDKQLFEYAVIRVVPKVERSEFINVGVIVYSAKLKFLGAEFKIDARKLSVFPSAPEMDALQGHIESYLQICKGGISAGPIGKLPIAERFRWLTAARSTILQSSPVHTGVCEDAEEELARLFQQMVL